MKKKSKLAGLGLGGAGVVIVLALAIGFISFQYTRYRDLAQRLPVNVVPIKIAILDPAPGAQSPVGSPLLVSAAAFGEKPFLSLELWANGVVVGVQAAPSGGTKPLKAEFSWIPAEAGDYSLIARAIDADKRTADSAAVQVLIGPSKKGADSKKSEDPSKVSQIANGGSGEGLPPSQTVPIPLPPPPAPPGSDDSIGTSAPWQGSLGDWVSQIMVTSPPAAPQLVAAPNGCGVKLSIHDLSSDEDGFFVYRRASNASQWEGIATLGSQSKFKWLTYTDSGHSGLLIYYVAAFNNAGQVAGNLATAKVDAADCPSNPPKAPLLSVELVNLKTDLAADKAYCFKSLDGIHWSRWPVTGFFFPGPQGLDTKGQTQSMLLSALDPKPLTLDLECWGWIGSKLQLLGSLHKEGIEINKAGDWHLVDKGLAADLVLGSGSPVKPLEGSGKGPQPPPPEIIDSRMPDVFALLAFDSEQCKEHLPSKGDNLFENLYCAWYGQYESNTQPYLRWWVNDELCANGAKSQGADCNSLAWYRYRAQLYGGSLRFRIGYCHTSGPYDGLCYTNVATTPYNYTVYVIPPLEPFDDQAGHANLCNTQVRYGVELFYDAGPNDPEFANLRLVSTTGGSAYWTYACPPLPPTEQTIDVTIDKLALDNVDDDDGGIEDVELYGIFLVTTSSMNSSKPGGMRKLGTWAGPPIGCPTEAFATYLPDKGSGGVCLESFTTSYHHGGDYNIGDLTLCSTVDKYGCWDGTSSTEYKMNNNHIQITVKEGDSIIMQTVLIDYDSNSGDDNVCVGTIWTASRSIDTWTQVNETGIMVQGDNGHASCKVFFHISSVSP